ELSEGGNQKHRNRREEEISHRRDDPGRKESVKRCDRTWSCPPFARLVAEAGGSFSTPTRWLPLGNGAFVRHDRRAAAGLKSAYHGSAQGESRHSTRTLAPPIW